MSDNTDYLGPLLKTLALKQQDDVQRHAQYLAALRQTDAELREGTDEYLKSGVARISYEFNKRMEAYTGTPARRYFRALSVQLERAFVCAEDEDWGGTCHLRVARNTRTQNIVAGLLLIARDLPGATHRKDTELDRVRHSTHAVSRVDAEGGLALLVQGRRRQSTPPRLARTMPHQPDLPGGAESPITRGVTCAPM